MMNTEILNNLSSKIREIAKNSPIDDLEKNVHALLKSAFTKLALVTREEFDVQTEVLRQAREELNTLEQKITALEAQSTK